MKNLLYIHKVHNFKVHHFHEISLILIAIMISIILFVLIANFSSFLLEQLAASKTLRQALASSPSYLFRSAGFKSRAISEAKQPYKILL